nr:TetR/AcrR family transcriptional regulator [Paenibacillus cymbidii]
MNRNSKRAAIVLAALRIAQKDGVEKLTPGAAAQAAGVSKGGLLHHFPNKDELIKAMITQAADEFDALVAAKAAGTEAAADTGRWSRAYLEATLEESRQETGLSTALALALFANPELLAKLQSQYAGWQRHLEQEVSTRWTQRSSGWRSTACGWRSCSGSARLPQHCGSK